MIDKHLEIHNILVKGLKDLNKIKVDNHKYWLMNREELNSLVQQYEDITDHMNDFISEVK